MWELDHKEFWAPKNWCFWTVVLEKTLESPLNCKEIQPVHPKGNHSWIFIERTDAEAETPILWPPDEKNWLIGKDPDAGKDWRQEEKGSREDEMVGWHHRLDGHEFEQALEVGEDRDVWRAKVHGVTKSWTRLSDWTELNFPIAYWTSLGPNKPVWRGINLSITYVYDSVFISNFSIICSLIWGRTPILFFIKSSKHWLTLDS